MSNVREMFEAFGGKANPNWLIDEVNKLYSEGHIQGEVQEGLVFAIRAREELEAEVKLMKGEGDEG